MIFSHHRHVSLLRESSKFFAGFITADLIIGIWALVSGIYPFSLMGASVSLPSIYAWIAADIVLLAFLVHYGWGVGIPGKNPRHAYLFAAGVLFLLVALAHLSRLVFDVPLWLGGLMIPYWLNLIGAIVAAFLSWASFAFAMQKS